MIIPLYVGFDPRTEIGYHTFVSSVLHTSTVPVSITPLSQSLLQTVWKAGRRDGSNDFTYLRFLIPWLQGFTGWAMFCDGSDMVLKGNLAELWSLRDMYKAVQVVTHAYGTRHPRKYVGTAMESDNRDYPRKNWSSVMLINCSHFSWRSLDPISVGTMEGRDLHAFEFVRKSAEIGALPVEWNWMADEMGENKNAKLIHYTAGIPAIPHYANSPMANDWSMAALKVNHITL